MKHRKNLILALVIIFTTLSSYAKDKVYVSPIETFSTETPSESINFNVTKNAKLGEYELSENDILHCNVIKVTKPKIGKRSATFTVSPVSYTTNETTEEIEKEFKAKYSKKLISKEEIAKMDKKELGIKAATKVGGHFVKGFAPVVSVAEGMIKNEDGNVITSGLHQLINDSPLGYLRKGKQITIEQGEEISLVFKPAKIKKNKKQEDIITEDNTDSQVNE